MAHQLAHGWLTLPGTRRRLTDAPQASASARPVRRARASAPACILERLESRQLLSLSVGVNFQPASSPAPAGYLVDSGAAYGAHGNGYTYGWSADHGGDTRDRNATSDQRYDTTILAQANGVYTWEMAVPNGTYSVHAVAGDASFLDGVYKYNAEGQTLIDGTPTRKRRFVEGTATVTVNDGRLTVSNAAGSQNNKLCFVDITGTDVTPPPSGAPLAPANLTARAVLPTQVNLAWTDNSSDEMWFNVERSTDGTTFTSLGTVGANIAAYADTTATPSTQYTYRVSAVSSSGSSPSNLATVTTPASTPTTTPTYVVSTTGSDRSSGSSAAPFRTIGKALSLAQAGEVILVKNGTYHETLTPPRSGTAGAPITVMGESTAGVILDGSGLSRVITTNGQSYITIQNLTVDHCANGPFGDSAAVGAGSHWTLQDLVVQNVDGTGIGVGGTDVTLNRVIAQHNGVAGMGGAYADTVLVKDCISRDNNYGMARPSWKSDPHAIRIGKLYYMSPDYEAGGGKWWVCTHVTIDGMQAYGNTGPGIWFDYNSSDAAVRNSTTYSNHGLPGSRYAYQGDGIRLELQKEGPWVVENNSIHDNSGPGITLAQDRNVTVRGNTLVNNNIVLRDSFVDAGHTMQNITITGNLLKNARFETWEGTWTTTSGTDKQIVIDGNTYDNGGGVLMSWAGTDYSSLDTIRSTLGFEASGRQAR